MAWQPLLSGGPAADARNAVQAIVAALNDPASRVEGAGYAGGHGGVALLFAYLAAAGEDSTAADRAQEHSVAALGAIPEEGVTLGLFSGLSGVAWTLHHLRALDVVLLDPALVDEVDDVIVEAVRRKPWTWKYDLVYGLTGVGLYALDHPDSGFREQVVESIVARLEELAEPFKGGVAWRTRPELLPLRAAKRFPNGRFDLGVAHGAAGVIGLLSRAVTAGVAAALAEPLLKRALTAILAGTRADDGGSTFPGQWAGGDPPSCRSAWCYGDPGIVAVLLGAARSLGDAELSGRALAIGQRACARPAGETGIVDAGLCHGAAGLAHLYNRLYQATGDQEFARASHRWFEHTLRYRNPVEGITAFPAWWPEAGEYRSDPSLLSGAAGVGLALLAATSSLVPQWDRPLLVDLAPMATAPRSGSRR